MIRRALSKDIEGIEKVAEAARAFLKANGSRQWQDGYPFREDFLRDIEKEALFVFEEDGEILGTVSLQKEEDENYAEIFEGKWLNEEPYVAVHRLAVLKQGGGVGRKLLGFAEEYARKEGFRNLRCDTTEENQVMHHLLNGLGYQRCGIIYLKRTPVHNKRVAYQKVLQKATN